MPDGPKPFARAERPFRADPRKAAHKPFIAQFPRGLPAVPDIPVSGPSRAVPENAGQATPSPDGRSAERQGETEVAAGGAPAPCGGAPGETAAPAGTGGLPESPPRIAGLPAIGSQGIDRRIDDARAAGRDEGRTEAMVQLAAERARVAEAARALGSALAALDRASARQIEVLASTLDRAVKDLAARRAGLAIDAEPAGFARRIARLAERVALATRQPMVRLNPADLEAVRAFLADTPAHEMTALLDARMTADPALQRGDVVVRTDDILIADLLDPDPCGVSE